MAHTAVEQPPTPTVRRGRGFWVGVTLVLAGVLVLGYVAWQFFGTNVVSVRKQQRIVERTQRMWSAHAPVSIGAEAVPHQSADALVRIPAFGADYVVPVQEGVSDGVLAEGFGHFDRTAGPGRVGDFALAAHGVTHGEALRDLPSLRPGDTVVVDPRTRTFTYRLDTDPRRLIVSFAGIWVVAPVRPRGAQHGPVTLCVGCRA